MTHILIIEYNNSYPQFKCLAPLCTYAWPFRWNASQLSGFFDSCAPVYRIPKRPHNDNALQWAEERHEREREREAWSLHPHRRCQTAQAHRRGQSGGRRELRATVRQMMAWASCALATKCTICSLGESTLYCRLHATPDKCSCCCCCRWRVGVFAAWKRFGCELPGEIHKTHGRKTRKTQLQLQQQSQSHLQTQNPNKFDYAAN